MTCPCTRSSLSYNATTQHRCRTAANETEGRGDEGVTSRTRLAELWEGVKESARAEFERPGGRAFQRLPH